MDITMLVTIAEAVAPEIISLVQSKGGTATIQEQLDADKTQIDADAKTLADELANDK
jgi:hypothetical protein